jgi:hypothetical protein
VRKVIASANLTAARLRSIAIALALALALSLAVAWILPEADDWHNTLRPATLAMLAGRSPYEITTYYGPPWALALLIPFAILPEALGRGLIFATSLAAVAYTVVRLGGRPLVVALVLLSPPAIQMFLTGNNDWQVLLGFVLPPPIGFIFVTAKPHVGLLVGVWWAIEAIRQRRFTSLAHMLMPIAILGVLSILLYGWWPARMFTTASLITENQNTSLWPVSIPVGLALFAAALRRRNVRFAMPATVCLSPHVILQSWLAALVPLSNSTLEMAAGVVGLWVLMAVRAMDLGIISHRLW